MKIFRFESVFIGLTILSSFTNANSLCCISINNQGYIKQDGKLLMLMEMDLCFFHLVLKQVNVVVVVIIISIHKAKICVPDVVKNLNVKLFNLIPRTNETIFIEWHETCKSECKIGVNVCNNSQRWNKNKCRCEFKELIDKEVRDKGFILILVIVSVNVIKLVMLVNI